MEVSSVNSSAESTLFGIIKRLHLTCDLSKFDAVPKLKRSIQKRDPVTFVYVGSLPIGSYEMDLEFTLKDQKGNYKLWIAYSKHQNKFTPEWGSDFEDFLDMTQYWKDLISDNVVYEFTDSTLDEVSAQIVDDCEAFQLQAKVELFKSKPSTNSAIAESLHRIYKF